MIRIIIGNIFQGLQAAIETIEKQLQPNLPFSPELKLRKIPVETSILRASAHRIKKKPSL
jgi:hypothetical protein